MKPVMRALLIVGGLMLTAGILYAVVIKERPTAQSNGLSIIVRWASVDETGVQRFVVQRREGWTGNFEDVGSIDPRGNNSSYEYIDRQVLKTTARIYQYRIRILNVQGPPVETDIVTVSHLSSTARRTWGSIKSMFR